MLAINVNTAEPGEIERVQRQLNSAAQAIGANSGGLEAILALGLAQLDRFVAVNVEVDTGRTKNSVFQHIGGGGQGNSIAAALATNVRYSPYVRDASHSQPFFQYAAEKEGPAVLEMLGEEVIIRVEEAFK